MKHNYSLRQLTKEFKTKTKSEDIVRLLLLRFQFFEIRGLLIKVLSKGKVFQPGQYTGLGWTVRGQIHPVVTFIRPSEDFYKHTETICI